MRLTVAFYVSSVPISLDVRDGRAGLGGSESACFGLARALAALGHDVHVHAQHLAEDATGKDAWGVLWHDAGADDAAVADWCEVVEPDVLVSLRMAHLFSRPMRARLRVLWNQDLLVGDAGAKLVLSSAWQVDQIWYVSEYHRQQWEGVCPDLKGLGHVIKNGYDPAHVPADVAKVPGRVCYITRPERGLAPLLSMWPGLKREVPHAELHITRYASMYDGEGGAVKAMCERFDRMTQMVAERVGGIVVHEGGLGKADLYALIASSEVMWYPGVADFAETSCVAAIEAQACGTAFVGSYKGALPETVPHGVLLHGDAITPEYQRASIDTVRSMLVGSAAEWVRRGRAHVTAYTYDSIARDVTAWLVESFERRYEASKAGILRQLLQYDDHCAAVSVAADLGDEAAVAFCQRVIAGKDQTADDYGDRARHDVLREAREDARIQQAASRFIGRARVLDVACGNGSFALALALADPAVCVVGYDYSADNIARATEAAVEAGVADRVSFRRAVIYDFDAQDVTDAFVHALQDDERYDGAFIGEFLEHVGNVPAVVNAVCDAMVRDGLVVCTMPSGPFTELMPPGVPIKRGHVHHFCYDDLVSVFGALSNVDIGVLQIPSLTPRGNPVAHWMVSFTVSAADVGDRDYRKRVLTTRPMPTLTVGLIVGPGSALDLPRCLETIHKVADEVVIALCDADEATLAVAEKYGARTVALEGIADLAGGFAEARNAVLAVSTGEWFLWIDADEQLLGSGALRKYLDATVFHGYVLRQNHLQIDAPTFFDEPVRLFRRTPDVQFYGVVHEQPQKGGPNGDIWPALAITEAQIAHYGYLTDGVRRRKSQSRNLSLLVRDRLQHADRRLGHVLWMREYATWLAEIGERRPTFVEAMQRIAAEYGADAVRALVFDGAEPPTSGVALARFAADYYEAHFPDPADKLAQLARPFYEACLKILPEAWEVAFTFAARQGGMRGGTAKPTPFWTRSFDDVKRMVAHAATPLDQAFHPAPIHTDPFPVAQEVTA
jgi:glycosyltransferase involved in cell wall biosynthesis/SAM-dependent methyltransferase